MTNITGDYNARTEEILEDFRNVLHDAAMHFFTPDARKYHGIDKLKPQALGILISKLYQWNVGDVFRTAHTAFISALEDSNCPSKVVTLLDGLKEIFPTD